MGEGFIAGVPTCLLSVSISAMLLYGLSDKARRLVVFG